MARARRIEGTESISQILRTPVIHILGQQSYLTGGQAAVRVIVTDSKNEIIAGRGSVRIELLVADAKPQARVFCGPVESAGNHGGAIPVSCRRGGQLPICAMWWIRRSARPNSPSRCGWKTRFPFFSPPKSQSTSRDRRSMCARWRWTAPITRRPPARKLTFEVEDSRGNKVFKKATADRQVRSRVGRIRLGRRSQPGHLPSARADGSEMAMPRRLRIRRRSR